METVLLICAHISCLMSKSQPAPPRLCAPAAKLHPYVLLCVIRHWREPPEHHRANLSIPCLITWKMVDLQFQPSCCYQIGSFFEVMLHSLHYFCFSTCRVLRLVQIRSETVVGTCRSPRAQIMISGHFHEFQLGIMFSVSVFTLTAENEVLCFPFKRAMHSNNVIINLMMICLD